MDFRIIKKNDLDFALKITETDDDIDAEGEIMDLQGQCIQRGIPYERNDLDDSNDCHWIKIPLSQERVLIEE